MRSWFHAAMLATLAAAAAPALADACSCASSTSPCQAFARPRVFIGEVQSVQTIGRELRYRLRVVRTFKGPAAETAEVWSDAHSSCGLDLTVGDRYVIYTVATGRIAVFACMPILHIPRDEPDPELPPLPGTIYGRVSRYDQGRIRSFKRLEAVPAVRVWVDLPGGRQTEVSDAWGRFAFRNVPPGKYPIGVDAGQGLTPWMSDSIELTASAGCDEASIVLQPSGALRGRVVTADGQPAAGINLLLYDAAKGIGELMATVEGAHTDKDGRFTIDGLRAGEYGLGLGYANGRQPYERAYYGGRTADAATRIGVGEGEPTVLAGPFVLPPALATRTVTYSLACRDGSVPEVFSASARTTTEPVIEDDEGFRSHTLTLLRDRAYTLHVGFGVPLPAPRPDGPRRTSESLPPIAIPAGPEPLTLALTAPFTNCADPPER
jgi:hypothetical protein